MKLKTAIFLMGVFGPLTALQVSAQASDLATPPQRQVIVDLGNQLVESRPATGLVTTPSPFTPPAFDQPDPEELRALQAAAAAGGSARPILGDRDVLEKLSELIVPSGIARLGGESILLFGQKKLKVGDRLTITFEGHEYDLDITAIGGTTFTLRYNREEVIRSIKPGIKP